MNAQIIKIKAAAMNCVFGKALTWVAVVWAIMLGSVVYAHCQVPCGIYDDHARIDMIAEHITTIEKAMKTIETLSAEEKPNMNQLVRWVNNKDLHADELSDIVTYYFMAQRLKPPSEGDAQAHEQYIKQLTLLHKMIVYSMKAKQTTDLDNVVKLRALLAEFHDVYSNQAALANKGVQTMQQRTITMKGSPLNLTGTDVKVGQRAPDFEATANDLSAVKLSAFQGKTLVILSVPSLDTSVCQKEARTFNERATSLGDDVVVLAVSMDLPFAQGRWCSAEGIKNVQTLSDHRSAAFGNAYGVLIEGLRLLARVVFVVDKEGVVRYKETVSELTHEPDYEAALKAVKEVTK